MGGRCDDGRMRVLRREQHQQPARVSATAAYRNPCLLITQSEAQAIVGKAGKPQFESGFKTGSGFKANDCAIIDRSDGTTIDVTVENVAFDPVTAKILINSAAPVPEVGHQAECGLGVLSLQPLSIKKYELYSAINSHYSLDVSGALSCAVDALFASKAYSRLS